MDNQIQSFYDWCEENNCLEILDRWDYEKNGSPKDCYGIYRAYAYFECENGIHDSEEKRLFSVMKYKKVPKCSTCNSFGCWCENHNRRDLLNRWDYDLNGITPYEVSFSAPRAFYFKCPRRIHESQEIKLNIITSNDHKSFHHCLCKKCNSIAQWGIDNLGDDFLEKYWSNKNSISPWSVDAGSHKKIWIRCQNTNYHQDYQIECNSFKTGRRCPYCSHTKLDKEHDSLGALYPDVFKVWVEKKTTPYDYFPGVQVLKTFHCDKHGNYRRRIKDAVNAGFECPKCARERKESRLQEKVRKYLETTGYTILHENNCTLYPTNPKTGAKLRYDNEIKELKILIEVHGEQHYHMTGFYYLGHKTEEEATKLFKYREQLDKFKKEYAIKQGYIFCAIPYWEDNKKETWKHHLNKVIKETENYRDTIDK